MTSATWALVVGIDEYEHFTPLTGAARDAAAATRWLLKVGVPKGQILLHAAPSAAAEAEIGALDLPVRGCTQPEIETSFVELAEHTGERLFVFLMGHGFYEPTEGRVFLTQESRRNHPANLGIEPYCRWLQGVDFGLQVVIFDGCQNLPYTQHCLLYTSPSPRD